MREQYWRDIQRKSLSSFRYRLVMVLFVLPPLVVFGTLCVIRFYLADETVSQVLTASGLQDVTWPSIERVIKKYGQGVYERMRAGVLVGIAILFVWNVVILAARLVWGTKIERPAVRWKPWLGVLLLCGASLFLIFVAPNVYASTAGRHFVPFAPNLPGLFTLTIILYAFFFFLLLPLLSLTDSIIWIGKQLLTNQASRRTTHSGTD